MKASTILISGATTLVLGTATAIPAENAIRNDVSKLKGKSFKEAYKDGYWKTRFFRADYGFDLSKQEKLTTLDGDEVCKANSNDWNYWLYELTQKEFQDMLSNLAGGSDVYFLLLVEFKKNNDWFNKSLTHAWFAVSGKKINGNETIILNRKQQILKIFNSKNETLTEEVFTALNNEESKISFVDSNSTPISSWYVHDDLLKSPLKLDMKKSGDCRKLEPKYRETV